MKVFIVSPQGLLLGTNVYVAKITGTLEATRAHLEDLRELLGLTATTGRGRTTP